MRVIQDRGNKGSLKWIQRAINDAPDYFDSRVRSQLPDVARIEWLSPLADDGFAEYRDKSFLERIGHPELSAALSEFWPSRGPQWDALGRADGGEILLVEAKAHIREMLSEGSKASEKSLDRISASLDATAAALRASPLIPWTGALYQTANRIAHLKFLIDHDVPARLLFVCFLDDNEMSGPTSIEEWQGAIELSRCLLGLPRQHLLNSRISHVFMSTKEIGRDADQRPKIRFA
ncbi:MAG: hypothetical protein AB7S93_01975 [Xanthobacteraceae bacterium]